MRVSRVCWASAASLDGAGAPGPGTAASHEALPHVGWGTNPGQIIPLSSPPKMQQRNTDGQKEEGEKKVCTTRQSRKDHVLSDCHPTCRRADGAGALNEPQLLPSRLNGADTPHSRSDARGMAP